MASDMSACSYFADFGHLVREVQWPLAQMLVKLFEAFVALRLVVAQVVFVEESQDVQNVISGGHVDQPGRQGMESG